MESAKHIDLASMAILILLLAIPLTLAYKNGVNILKDLSVSLSRGIAQLFAVALVLQYIFNWEYFLITTAWLLIMILYANYNLLQKSNINIKNIFFHILWPLLVSTIFVLFFFVLIVIRPEPLYSARYLIPIYGMILGNGMNSSILVLERFYTSIKNNRKEYLTYLALGGTESESSHRFLADAYKASLLPLIANFSTMGIVSLPGMMTGQILGGSTPLVAVQYQVGIMVAIFSSVALSSLLVVITFRNKFFDQNGIPRLEIF